MLKEEVVLRCSKAEDEKVARMFKVLDVRGPIGYVSRNGCIYASRDAVHYTEVFYSKCFLEKVSNMSGDAEIPHGFCRFSQYLIVLIWWWYAVAHRSHGIQIRPPRHRS